MKLENYIRESGDTNPTLITDVIKLNETILKEFADIDVGDVSKVNRFIEK
jgi:hypothetical protein